MDQQLNTSAASTESYSVTVDLAFEPLHAAVIHVVPDRPALFGTGVEDVASDLVLNGGAHEFPAARLAHDQRDAMAVAALVAGSVLLYLSVLGTLVWLSIASIDASHPQLSKPFFGLFEWVEDAD